jgi:hypothetical protein
MTSSRLAAILALSASVAGCGGSSSSSSTLTHAQLVTRANAICAQRNASIQALPKSLAHLTDLKTLATYLGDLLSINGPLLNKLEGLKPPAADQSAWNQAIADNRAIQQLIAQTRTAALAGNGPEVRRLTIQIAPLGQKITAAASQLGLSECLKQPVPSA